MNARIDIQILRGVAVLLVVLFHLGLEKIQSGYLGVDIFFVVSGFLMAILYRSGDVLQFYLKRAQRLLPAYFFVIIVTLLVSYIITTPNEFNQVIQQAKYASVFSSNIGFWMQNSYFSKAEFNPLLHLWSLGVEIQFYAVVPILFILFKRRPITLPVFLMVSLACCLVIVTVSPKTAFFLTPFRMWEFLLGYATAVYFSDKGASKYPAYSWIGGVGFLSILLIPLFRINGKSLSPIDGHPALYAVLVSLATCIVLIFSIPKVIEHSYFGRALSRLGDYSYAIYLVHFPIIVLYLSHPFSGTITTVGNAPDALVIITLTVILSVALHHLIEKKGKLGSLFTIAIAPVFVIAALTLILEKIQYRSLSESEKYIFTAFSDRSPYRCGKLIRVLRPSAVTCSLNPSSGSTQGRIMLVGNSHADSLKTSFANVATAKGVEVLFISANNPLMPNGLRPENIIEEAKKYDVSTIVLHYSASAININTFETLLNLSNLHSIKVAFIDPVPVWPQSVPQAMYQRLTAAINHPAQNIDDYNETHADLFKAIDSLNIKGLKRHSIAEVFCKPECQFSSSDGVPYYFDRSHLTLTGSALLETVFDPIIQDAAQ